MSIRERIEWCDIWVADADKDDLPRALLVGDSITRSYYPFVSEDLKESYAVARVATSAFLGDPMFLQQLQPIVEGYDFPVIHFNNGLHGWEYSEDQYADGLESVLNWLKERVPAARLIVALSTPVRDKNQPSQLDAKTQRVQERNQIARDAAQRHTLEVNDLFSLVIDHPEYYSPDGVHFLEEGQKVLGEQVASVISNPGQ